MSTRTDLITDMFTTFGPFWRQIRRASGPGFGTGLTQAQSEMMRLVGRNPGVSVSEAATHLGLASNTASTLVSKLSGDGLLLRETDPDDRRVGRLRLSDTAQQIADESRTVRREALTAVIDQLSSEEIDSLTAGLEVMARMTGLLEAQRT